MSEQPLPLEQLRGLLEKLRESQSRTDERAKATHERFNVFTTLLEANDEVRLHTRFLHSLLDPEGCHDCEDLFLKLFFETLANIPGENDKGEKVRLNLPTDKQPWTIENESSQGDFGRIDLLLEQKQTRFGIAIENKIDANEQPLQIKRYADFLSVPGRFSSKSRVIYLTLRGDKSQTHGDKDYIRISYADHILTWLDKCLKKTHEIVPIYQVILQYREVVRHLTGKIEPAFVKTISEFIAENPDIIRYRQEINHGIDKACGDCMDKLADGIAKELGGRFNVRRPANLAQGKFDSKPYFARIIDPPQNSPLYNKPFEIWVAEHCRGLMIGVESCFGKSPLIQEQENLLKKMYAILLQESKTSGYSCCDANNLFCGTHWLTGWHPIHPELIRIDEKWLTSLYDSKTMADTVSKVCTAIRDHIGLLEKAYNQAIQTTNTQP